MKKYQLKHFLLFLLSVMLFVSCEKPSISAPTGVNGLQVDNTIVLSWNRVDGAIGYDIYKGGINIGTVYSLSYTDKNPSAGNNYYDVYAFDEKSRSQASSIVVKYEESETHGTTPLTSVSSQDVIGYWQLTPCNNSASFDDKWYIQFNTDGTFVEERKAESNNIYDYYGVGVWNVQKGILNLQYYESGYSRFYDSGNHSHTLYVTQFTGSSAELYLLDFLFQDDEYYTMQRLSYDDQSFSGNISANGSNSISKAQLVGTWLYADKSGAHYYTFKNNGSYNRVYMYEFTGYNYNNYNGTFTISNNTITANVTQLIEAIVVSSGNASYLRRSTVSLTEQYSFQSINGNSIVWKENGVKHRCFKVPASPNEKDS